MDVGPHDKTTFLATDQYAGPDLRFIQKFSKSAVKIINQIRVEQVQGSLRVIKDQHSHTVLPPANLQHISHTASMSTAVPRAPAAQEVTRPMPAFSCSIRAAQFISNRAPVAPKGCPMDSDPPQRLSRSGSTRPTPPSRSRRERRYSSFSRSLITVRTGAAKASWNSSTPTSSRSRPAESSTRGTENTGPNRSSSLGSPAVTLSLIHISEPTRLRRISYAVFCLKKKKKQKKQQ